MTDNSQGLSGKTSDRIRSGEIDPETLNPPKRHGAADQPTTDAIQHGSGHALGDPNRSAPDAATSED